MHVPTKLFTTRDESDEQAIAAQREQSGTTPAATERQGSQKDAIRARRFVTPPCRAEAPGEECT